MKTIIGLAASLLISFSAAAVGALATRSAPEFYATLSRPSWAPPASVFGPVWTVLYILMAVAAWLVWKQARLAGARTALVLYTMQLVLNALWSWLFFAWRNGTVARIDIMMLIALIVLTTVAFWRVYPLAGALMLPYAAWVSFATALTFSLVRRNPGLLG